MWILELIRNNWQTLIIVFNPVSAVAVWVFLNLIWPELQRWREIRRQIISALTKYGNVAPAHVFEGNILKVHNRDELKKAEDHIRELAGDIESLRHTDVYRSFLVFIPGIPKPEGLEKIKSNLIGWANTNWSERKESLREVFKESLLEQLGLPNDLDTVKEIYHLEIDNARKH